MGGRTSRIDIIGQNGNDGEHYTALDKQDAGKHYRYEYRGAKLDPFRICDIYGVNDFGQGTLIKKSLRLGTAHKDRKQDLLDIINCAERMLEMMSENNGD